MNIVIDAGNTFTKLGIFENDKLNEKHAFERDDGLADFLRKTPVENILVSSVSPGAPQLLSWSIASGKRLILKASLPLPIENHYATPGTLGVDRLAAACGAHFLFPRQDCLVIDAGTCINYEFINKEGQYFGGGISPGVRMRFEAMHHHTASLPLAPAVGSPKLIGSSTIECLQSGVMNGVLGELQGTISRYSAQYPDVRVILCGGDAHFFEKDINPSIFVAPDLVLIGLNSILLHNVAL
jgi:type III pantothenate kinase